MHMYEKVIREMIRNEHTLLNNRTSWMNALHGFLFAALGFGWEEDPITYILSFVGISVSIITIIGVLAATMEICRLSDWWEANKPEAYSGPGVTGMQRIMEYRYLRHLAPWNFLPVVLLTAWISVAIIK